MAEKKKGFLARRAEGTARYVYKRFGNSFINEVGVDSVKQGASVAREAMTPKAFDREDFNDGLNGRYQDGGVVRFAELMRENGLKEADLQRLSYDRRKSAGIMFLAAAFFLILGAYFMVTAETGSTILFGFSTAFVSLCFISVGVRHDFSRWQIESRRFGGFRDYLNDAKTTPSKLD